MKAINKLLKTGKSNSYEKLKQNFKIENAMTQSEKQIWLLLDKLKIQKSFTRQYTFKYFILDFYSEVLKISIELDSKTRYHNKEADAIKKQLLDDGGVKQIIIQKEDLKENEKKVLEELKRGIGL